MSVPSFRLPILRHRLNRANRSKRTRLSRRLFRAIAVVGALAAVFYGVSAVPAHAQTITSGGPYTITYPGGDLVNSVDVPGVDPTTMNNIISTNWPEFVGLSSGASPSDLFQATWQDNSSILLSFTPSQLDQPPTFSGGSISVSSDGNGGTTATIDIPGADVQANTTLPSWLQGVLATAAGAAAGILAGGICTLALLAIGGAALVVPGGQGAAAVLTTLGASICSAFLTAVWTFVSSVVGQALSGKGFSADIWWKILGATLTAALAGAAVPALVPCVAQVMKTVLTKISNGIVKVVQFISSWVGSAWNGILSAIQKFFARGTQQAAGIELGNIIRRSGLQPSAASGRVTAPPAAVTRPGNVASANCMDAYGSNGGADANQPVAINSCNGNPAQDWDYYSNGMVSVWGLCLDTGTPSGSALVSLQPCDGDSSQQWNQVGTTLVNQSNQECLDDPGGNTSPGTQLDVAPCNGSPEQLWLSPQGEPCDIYAFYGTGCTAAYSMTRAMYADYDGALYQVQRASDDTTADIGVQYPGGGVNASEQDSFCANTTCTVTQIYDQSPGGNNLTIEGGGGNGGQDQGANATALPITIGGNKAYGLDIEPGIGYRDDTTVGVATDGEPEGMYMVASGTHVNSSCCFDFGNAEANGDDNGAGHMDAVNLTTWCGSNSQPCSGSGPWVQADLENGQWMGNGSNPNNTGNNTSFVTAMLQNDGQSNFALEGGDSTTGGLSQWYSGPLPSGYSPMQQEGAVVLGTGGDNSNGAVGSWFEGVMTAGEPSTDANNAVQANIVSAGYSGNTNPSGGGGGGNQGATPSAAGPAVVHSAGATGAGAAGFSSVYTVDSSNGHLQETYLPFMGDSWTSQDLTAQFGTPPVMPGTQPVALVHCGWTSVYTIDASDGDLQETYLSAIGNEWATQDLSVNYGTPPTDETPTAVEHYAGATDTSPGCGFTSVYTVDRNGDLQETYLPSAGFPGDPWTTQDLSVNYGTPKIQAGTSPVAIVHCGFTSVYTVDANHQLQETYLPSIGGPWNTQSLSANYGTPLTTTTPTAVVHFAGATDTSPGCGFTSVYTVDASDNHLQETYLPSAGFPGDPWTTQDLSANYGTPPVAPGTAPVALVHMNFTSVYTVDEGSDQLQETYLPSIGDAWNTQSLSQNYGTPTTDQTPIVLLHPDASGNLDWTSVYTINEFNNDLQETYLPNTGFPGDPWITQDLSANYGTPTVAVLQPSQASWSVDHLGYTSTYTVDQPSGDLQETYLPSMGAAWNTQDLSQNYGTPTVTGNSAPIALVHDGYTSVYTVDKSNGDLQETYLPGTGFPGDAWNTQDLSQNYGTPPVAANTNATALFHDGVTSVYTVDRSNGDLQETYLPGQGFPGDAWVTQNLSANYGTPPVMAGTSPVAIMHDGFVSVYTVDASDGHLQETYLPTLGGPWNTQDLTANYGTPPTSTSPTAVFHDGYTSVYTVNENGNDLDETYLPAMGDAWNVQDLSANYDIPTVKQGMAPAALYHTGYTSVYFVDQNGNVDEAYLGAITGPWQWQDLSENFGTPPVDQPVSPLVHYAANGGLTWTSIYSVDSGSLDLQETYLPAIGDHWTTQDLSQLYGTPPV